MAPRSASTGTVLFRTPKRPWNMIVMAIVYIVVIVPISVGLVVIAVVPIGFGQAPVLAAVVVLLALGMLIAGVWFIISGRHAFTVTTGGIEVAKRWSTRRYPWESIALIRTGSGTLLAPYATEIVLKDGSIIRPFATSMRYAVWRGESELAHGRDGRQPTASTLAAIDAHQRYLAGNLSGFSRMSAAPSRQQR